MLSAADAAARLGALLRRERRAAGYSIEDLSWYGDAHRSDITARQGGNHLGAPGETVRLLRVCCPSHSTLEEAERLALHIQRSQP